jgi:hypothetical protein
VDRGSLLILVKNALLTLLLPVVVFFSLAAGQVKLEVAPTGATYNRIVQLLNGGRLFAGSRQMSNSLGLYSRIQYSQIALTARHRASVFGEMLVSNPVQIYIQ